VSLNGKSGVESREAVGRGLAGPSTQPPIEYLNGEYLTCEICGQRMSERHCKIVCSNCGYTRDCSDP